MRCLGMSFWLELVAGTVPVHWQVAIVRKFSCRQLKVENNSLPDDIDSTDTFFFCRLLVLKSFLLCQSFSDVTY